MDVLDAEGGSRCVLCRRNLTSRPRCLPRCFPVLCGAAVDAADRVWHVAGAQATGSVLLCSPNCRNAQQRGLSPCCCPSQRLSSARRPEDRSSVRPPSFAPNAARSLGRLPAACRPRASHLVLRRPRHEPAPKPPLRNAAHSIRPTGRSAAPPTPSAGGRPFRSVPQVAFFLLADSCPRWGFEGGMPLRISTPPADGGGLGLDFIVAGPTAWLEVWEYCFEYD